MWPFLGEVASALGGSWRRARLERVCWGISSGSVLSTSIVVNFTGSDDFTVGIVDEDFHGKFLRRTYI